MIRDMGDEVHCTIRVTVETTVEPSGNVYIVTTIMSGKALKKIAGVEYLVHKEVTSEAPPQQTKICEIEILDPNLEIDDLGDMPDWSYEIYGNPALSMPFYVKADPINLVIDTSFSQFDYQLKKAGWETSSSWDLLSANVNYVQYEGRMIPQIKNYFLESGDGERYHLRIWKLGDIFVGQAHKDRGMPHEAYWYEGSETMVVRCFCSHIVRRNCIWLSNRCVDPQGYVNNGWASYIKTYKQYH
ncbi:MAG TPA: hypothetical protein PK718_04825 [Candidatus Methanofastidiosa archaeon]|nr:hypothetical protein [Candidatus Methanofastidiosa archaeon]HPR41853.1 hypothetical protein [Candidatus Methanofastidiosa archaeon]